MGVGPLALGWLFRERLADLDEFLELCETFKAATSADSFSKVLAITASGSGVG